MCTGVGRPVPGMSARPSKCNQAEAATAKEIVNAKARLVQGSRSVLTSPIDTTVRTVPASRSLDGYSPSAPSSFARFRSNVPSGRWPAFRAVSRIKQSENPKIRGIGSGVRIADRFIAGVVVTAVLPIRDRDRLRNRRTGGL